MPVWFPKFDQTEWEGHTEVQQGGHQGTGENKGGQTPGM